MGELSEAEKYLLEGIRRGDGEAWSRLVERFRGRLYAFAKSRLRSAADAEDVVQETFVTFLRALPTFRGEAAVETFLFVLLRRRLVDFYRGRRVSVCLLHDVVRPGEEPGAEPLANVPGDDPTASVYARRDERDSLRREALAAALRELINGYKKALNFRDLKIIEMLFYCQLGNRESAEVAGIGDKQVALIKHRALKRIADDVQRRLRRSGVRAEVEGGETEAMLTHVWETRRLSCPKRNTLGAWHLGTLDEAWADYVGFHLDKLGCQYCRANLDDIRRADAAGSDDGLRRRILQSTIGFLRQSYR